MFNFAILEFTSFDLNSRALPSWRLAWPAGRHWSHFEESRICCYQSPSQASSHRPLISQSVAWFLNQYPKCWVAELQFIFVCWSGSIFVKDLSSSDWKTCLMIRQVFDQQHYLLVEQFKNLLISAVRIWARLRSILCFLPLAKLLLLLIS